MEFMLSNLLTWWIFVYTIFIVTSTRSGLLRSITRKLGVPQRLRILTYAKFALHGSSPKLNPATGKSISYKIEFWKSCFLGLAEAKQLGCWLNSCLDENWFWRRLLCGIFYYIYSLSLVSIGSLCFYKSIIFPIFWSDLPKASY